MRGNMWNPVLETLPAEALRVLQFRRFKRILTHAYENSPFYRRLYQRSGITPDDIRDLAQALLKDRKLALTLLGPVTNTDAYEAMLGL